MTSDEFGDIEQLDENLRKWFKEKWVRFGPDGKIRGACARGDDSEGKPKCLPQKKAHAIGKKGRKYAAAKKRREDPNPERRGKAKNVATKKKTNEGVPFNQCPQCGGEIVHETMMNEKKDACYHKVKARYKVWPSAYASGALVQCRKKGASNWGTGGKKNESSIMKGLVKEEIAFSIYIDNSPYTNYSNKIEAVRDLNFLQQKFPNRKIEIKQQDDDVNIVEPKKNIDQIPLTTQHSGNKQKIAYSMKHGGKVPKELTFSTEGVIIGHDATDPDVAVLGGGGTYKLSNLKKKALGEAKQLAQDIANGEYKNSAYNVKQLANTLNTIVAAEDEMEKGYFGEAVDWQRGENNNQHDHSFQDAEEYLTHVYPVVKKYMVPRAEVGFRATPKHFLKSWSHMKDVDAVIKYLGLNKLPTMSGSKQATSSIGYTWTTFLSPNKKAAVMYYQDRGMGQDMVYIAAADKPLHRKIYDVFVDAGVIAGRDKKLQEPELPDAMRVSNVTNRDDAFKKAMDKFYNKSDDKDVNEDYTGEFAAEVTPEINPYGGKKDRQFRGAISETPTDNPTGASGEGGWRKYKPKSAGVSESMYTTDIKQYASDLAKEMRREGYDWEPVDLVDTEEAIDDAREQLSMFASSTMCDAFGDYDAGEQLQIIKMFNKKFGGVREDTAYAGGGQGGNAGESYRKFKPKSAGTFKEEQLDETGKVSRKVAIQDLQRRFAIAKANPKSTPEQLAQYQKKIDDMQALKGKWLEEEQLDEKCWDTHKQVGMKKKGDKMVPNCVPKESAIMKGLTGKRR